MHCHLLNLYEIRNASELRSDYRLVEIDGLLSGDREDGYLVERNLSLLSKKVAFQ